MKYNDCPLMKQTEIEALAKAYKEKLHKMTSFSNIENSNAENNDLQADNNLQPIGQIPNNRLRNTDTDNQLKQLYNQALGYILQIGNFTENRKRRQKINQIVSNFKLYYPNYYDQNLIVYPRYSNGVCAMFSAVNLLLIFGQMLFDAGQNNAQVFDLIRQLLGLYFRF